MHMELGASLKILAVRVTACTILYTVVSDASLSPMFHFFFVHPRGTPALSTLYRLFRARLRAVSRVRRALWVLSILVRIVFTISPYPRPRLKWGSVYVLSHCYDRYDLRGLRHEQHAQYFQSRCFYSIYNRHIVRKQGRGTPEYSVHIIVSLLLVFAWSLESYNIATKNTINFRANVSAGNLSLWRACAWQA